MFYDLDMTNSFHQLLLDDETSKIIDLKLLGVGLPQCSVLESVGPVSGVFQSIVFNLFSEFSELVMDCSPHCKISPHHLLSQPTFLRLTFQHSSMNSHKLLPVPSCNLSLFCFVTSLG